MNKLSGISTPNECPELVCTYIFPFPFHMWVCWPNRGGHFSHSWRQSSRLWDVAHTPHTPHTPGCHLYFSGWLIEPETRRHRMKVATGHLSQFAPAILSSSSLLFINLSKFRSFCLSADESSSQVAPNVFLYISSVLLSPSSHGFVYIRAFRLTWCIELLGLRLEFI